MSASLAPSLLVIDDEASICLAFERFFAARGWIVHVAASAADGLAASRRLQPTAVFLDVRLPDCNGLDLLERLAGGPARTIVITAYGDLHTVTRALRHQAFDYLTKPIDLDQAFALAERIRRAAATPAPVEHGTLPTADHGFIGASAAMQAVYKRIAQVAALPAPVLIEGETGTGKELAARAIHRFSPRAAGPFVAVNCGALPEHLVESELFGHTRGAFTGAETDRPGRFESAQGGCLLLDEIGELPAAAQVKLLRVLDEAAAPRVGSSTPRGLDVRVLAATNRDLAAETAAGRFRADLYYRLAVLRVTLPPLRQRPEDIPALASFFLNGPEPLRAPRRIDDPALQVLMAHTWPGNVRELKSVVTLAAATAPGPTLLRSDLPELRPAGGPAPDGVEAALPAAVIGYAEQLAPDARRRDQTMAHAERALIQHALRRTNGNQSAAAAYLGVHRNTLRLRLRELGIEAG